MSIVLFPLCLRLFSCWFKEKSISLFGSCHFDYRETWITVFVFICLPLLGLFTDAQVSFLRLGKFSAITSFTDLSFLFFFCCDSSDLEAFFFFCYHPLDVLSFLTFVNLFSIISSLSLGSCTLSSRSLTQLLASSPATLFFSLFILFQWILWSTTNVSSNLLNFSSDVSSV